MAGNWFDLFLGSAGALALSAAARALPAPSLPGWRGYAWFYHATQLVLANFDKVAVRS